MKGEKKGETDKRKRREKEKERVSKKRKAFENRRKTTFENEFISYWEQGSPTTSPFHVARQGLSLFL